MPHLQVNGRPLFWRDAGAGPPVIFLMGLETDHRGWFNVIPRLAPALRCISIDNRDVGKSGLAGVSYTIADMAADAIAVADSLSLDTFSVVGQSMGGAIAQEIARSHPGRIDRMVLLSSFCVMPERTRRALAVWKMLKRRLAPRDYYSVVTPWMYTLDECESAGLFDLILDRAAGNPFPQPHDAFDRQVDAILAFDSRSWLPALRIPTLVMAGDEDLITPPPTTRLLQRSIVNSELILVPAAGHALALTDKLAPCLPRLTEFISSKQ